MGALVFSGVLHYLKKKKLQKKNNKKKRDQGTEVWVSNGSPVRVFFKNIFGRVYDPGSPAHWFFSWVAAQCDLVDLALHGTATRTVKIHIIIAFQYDMRTQKANASQINLICRGNSCCPWFGGGWAEATYTLPSHIFHVTSKSKSLRYCSFGRTDTGRNSEVADESFLLIWR